MFNNFILEDRPKIMFGKEQINNLSVEISDYKNILFIYGQGSIKENGLYDSVIQSIGSKNVFELGGITPNPRLSDINKGIEICKENKIDFILAVGGGSVLDAAKAISIGAKSEFDIWDIIVNKKDIKNKVDLGTILTMIATGSETNDIFVVYNDYINLKRSIKTKYAYPTFAIMDPTYTTTIPKRQTVNGIVDTISHILEQYINNKDNFIVNNQLLTLLKSMFEIGKKLVDDLENYELRASHMYIAMVGYNGDFRTIVGGDWACHGLDYGLASEFNNYHGEGLSIMTPNWLEYIYKNKSNTKVLEEGIKKIFDTNDVMEGITKFRDYLNKIGAPLKYKDISDLNIILDEKTLNSMIEKSQFTKPLGGTYPLDEKDIKEIYLMGE